MNRPLPTFVLGERVQVILNDRNRTPHVGTIREIVWHQQHGRYYYFLLEVGKKISKRYAAEDLESLYRKLLSSQCKRIWPLWCDLDELLMRDLDCVPWESQNPEVHAVWECLTHPDQLAALEEWAQDVESFNDFAKECTLRAIAECRARAMQPADPAVVVIRVESTPDG